MDQRVAHHGERAALARTFGKAQVFVVQREPEHLQQPGKLFRRDAGAGFVQQFRGDAHLLQQARVVVAGPARTAEGRSGVVTGDGTFAHARASSMEGRMVAITRCSDKADIRQIVGRDTASWRKPAMQWTALRRA